MPRDDERDVTQLPSAAPMRPPSTGSSAGWLSSSDAISHGRFAPGTVLTERYRVVGLLGKGGMGEVYRADDLKLGQPVALKLLPPSLASDAARLAQFHGEVRLARQISHPNVCRVYDVDEIDGHPFLSMEYVDGEDLASLLRRIGRLPEDKALEIARQLCAGVAAAHDRGVLHRDLKPANVMLDGRGQVRVMDFGLAVVSGATVDVRAGTPAYMAPEQLAGREVSVRSDVYALGLVLFELFTGRRAFDARDLAELLRLHNDHVITPPTRIVPGLDPAIERAILRCLDPDPVVRPPSARAVAAALPGGDPLAAALAAGETPSPAMVAAAGNERALSSRIAVGSIAAVVTMLAIIAVTADRTLLLKATPPTKAIDVLVERAQSIRTSLGYTDVPRDDYYSITEDEDYLRYVSQTDQSMQRWDRLRLGRPAAIQFWYRTSPRDLVRYAPGRAPTLADPPLTVPGMTSMVTDMQGRLIEFHAVPPHVDGTADPPPATNWRALFTAAELPMESFAEATPTWTPGTFADARMAWEGPLPEDPSARVRIEASSYRGRPVFFATVGPWTRAGRMDSEEEVGTDVVLTAIAIVIFTALLVAAGIMARRHIRRGRGDRRGADRLAFAVIGLYLVAWVFGGHHFADIAAEINALFLFMAMALLLAAFEWLLYLALEPLVRRWQPHTLVGWTRLLSGTVRDPQVGRDVLAGVVAGCLWATLRVLQPLVGSLGGAPPSEPLGTALEPLVGVAETIGGITNILPSAVSNGMLLILAFTFLRLLFRRTWAAAAVVGLVIFGFSAVQMRSTPGAAMQLVLIALFLALMMIVVIRFGLLTTIVMFFIGPLLSIVPLTADPSMRYFATAMWVLAGVVGLAVVAASAARAGQPLLRFADE